MNKIKLICPIDEFIGKHITRDANAAIIAKFGGELATLFNQSVNKHNIVLDEDNCPIQVYYIPQEIIEQFKELNGNWFRFVYTNILYDASIKLEIDANH